MQTALKFGLIALATTVSLPAMAFTHEGMTPAVLAYSMAAVYAEDCGSFTPEVAAAADAREYLVSRLGGDRGPPDRNLSPRISRGLAPAGPHSPANRRW